jgi:two-component system, OmpR family, copper resistance phosphate regulon response regulator CusR
MKILIVEDETKLADALARGLKTKGYTADTISDGAQALERITLYHADYDVIILDLMLPSMDGETICAEVRRREITTPIIILTARDETDSKVKMLHTGADDYLAKPFSFEELDARIIALLRRPTSAPQTLLQYKDIVLNPATRTVTRDGEPIQLTLKEFALLEYFLRNQNRVINREELLNHLWDFNYTSFFSNALDVHIKNLRKKIDHDKQSSIFETVRGIGYKLAP